MTENRKFLNRDNFLFRSLRKLRHYRQLLFLPISRPFNFLTIKFQVANWIRKKGLNRIGDVLEALSSGVLYSFASFVEGDILEFGTQTGRTATILAQNVNYHNSKLGRVFGRKKLHLFDSFAGLPDPQSNLVDSENLMVINGVWSEKQFNRIKLPATQQ